MQLLCFGFQEPIGVVHRTWNDDSNERACVLQYLFRGCFNELEFAEGRLGVAEERGTDDGREFVQKKKDMDISLVP